MKISFVIPAYNEEHLIGECLDAIIRERASAPCTVEIIVVNNASTDGTAAAVQAYADRNVILVNEPKKGIVQARRAGFLASSGDLIANVDADTKITPGWIQKVFEEFSKDERLVALSGPFIYYDAPRAMQIITSVFYRFGYFFYMINRFIVHTGSMLQGGKFVVRKSALEKIGGYDTSISFYGEDSDVARRMSRVGNVKFTFALPAYSSGRRLAKEGGFTIGLRYAINYFWVMFLKRPFTQNYSDVRPGEKNSYKPENKIKEWIIALTAIIVLLAILGGIAFGIYYALERTGTITILKGNK